MEYYTIDYYQESGMRFINNLTFKKSGLDVRALFSRDPKLNPYGYLEHPDERTFGHAAPERIVPIKRSGETGSDPVFHYAKHDDDRPTAIAKPSHSDAGHEALAYRLGKHLVPGLVPKTVVRHYHDPFLPNGAPGSDELVPHSVQEYMKPHPTEPHPEIQDIAHEPDFHKMALFDYLIGNWDRKPHNILRDENGKLNAIDHAHAFSYWRKVPFGFPFSDQEEKEQFPMVDANYTGIGSSQSLIQPNLTLIKRLAGDSPIPEDFRKNVLHGNHEQMRNLIKQAGSFLTGGRATGENSVANRVADNFSKRFGTLGYHLSDPKMKTMGQLHDALYSNDELGDHRDSVYGKPPFYQGEHEGMWG